MSRCGGRPKSLSASSTSPTRAGLASCSTERFTETQSSPPATPCRRHSAAWRTASRRIQPPSSAISPACSAMGMNCAGRDHAPLGVLPADQRLGADDRAALGDDDRLVVEDELVGGDRAAQLRLELHPPQQRRVHALLVEAIGAGAVVLGAVERDVGVAQHLVGGRLLAAVDQGDAGGGGDREPAAGELERLGERVEQVAGHLRGGLGRGAGLEQHGELVAAEAGGGVARGEPLGEPAGADAQQLVARGMAERVVDLLEVVEVEEEDGEALLRGRAGVERVLEPVDEQRAVREVGQRVVERAVGEPVLQRDAVRHVARVDDGAADGGVVQEVRALVLDPAVAAVAVAPAHEQRAVDRARAVEQALVLRAHPLAVVGVHDVDELGAGERLGRIAEDVLDRGRLEADRAVLVEHGHDVGGVVDQRAVPGVGLAAGEPGGQPRGLQRHAELPGEASRARCGCRRPPGRACRRRGRPAARGRGAGSAGGPGPRRP